MLASGDIIGLIRKTLANNGFDLNIIDNMSHFAAIESRKTGKQFSFAEHIGGLVYSLLSNQRPWKRIAENEEKINTIFFDFDKDTILNTDSSYFVAKLKEISCGNRAITKQMASLKTNIGQLEIIEREHGSLDRFVAGEAPYYVAKQLSDPDGRYKLKQVGVPLAVEYMRNVGVDTVKPDTHLRRILKRLRYCRTIPSEKETFAVIDAISGETGFGPACLDALYWNFCAVGYGGICGEKPLCNKCLLQGYCDLS